MTKLGLEETVDSCARIAQAALGEEGEALGWIAVGDSLPVPGTKILAYFKNFCGKDRRIMAFHAPRFAVEADGEDEADEYCEEKDQYYLKEGWYEQNEFDEVHWYVDGAITHWMPLPEVPKIAQAELKEGK